MRRELAPFRGGKRRRVSGSGTLNAATPFHTNVTRITDAHAIKIGGGLDLIAQSSRRDWIVFSVTLAGVGVGLLIVLVMRAF